MVGPAAWRCGAAPACSRWRGSSAASPRRRRLPSAAHAEELARVERYLNGLTTLKADFVQINPDGGTVTGELYYQRPDKMRLDYNPPSDILIVSDGWTIVYYDRRLEQVSHLFPNSTPLGFLLRDKIRLSGDVTVTDVRRSAGELHVTLVQTDEPNQGSIQLSFAEEPLRTAPLDRIRCRGPGDAPGAGKAPDRAAAGSRAVPFPRSPVLPGRAQLTGERGASARG